eukprot:364988-Chlamydomonas_euryale.AAC.31
MMVAAAAAAVAPAPAVRQGDAAGPCKWALQGPPFEGLQPGCVVAVSLRVEPGLQKLCVKQCEATLLSLATGSCDRSMQQRLLLGGLQPD